MRAATYCMGTLCESDEIKAEALELGVLEAMILVESNTDMEVKRNVGYFMALVSEQQEYHENITKRGGLQVRGACVSVCVCVCVSWVKEGVRRCVW